jgi:acyl-CoA synthetase (AMP-forming)/AMP-acid ligase II
VRIGDVLALDELKWPNRPALTTVDGSCSFGELASRSRRLANGLLGLARPGDRIGILAENRPEYVECYYGVPSAGMALTFLNHRLHPRELARICADAGVGVLVTEAEYLEVAGMLSAEVASLGPVVVCGEGAEGHLAYDDLLAAATDDEPSVAVADDALAWLIYTSGTTGVPKGAMLSHRNVMTAVLASGLGWELEQDAVNLFPWPLCHIAGYSILVAHLFGGEVVLMRRYEPGDFLAHIERHRATRTSVAPTMLSMLLRHPDLDRYDVSSLRAIGYGSASMPAEVLRQAMARWPGVRFSTGFGMTELAGNVLYLGDEEHRRALEGDDALLRSVGRPLPLAAVRVVDDHLVDVAVGEVGELVVRGEQVTMGYWGRPEATAEAFVGGWFHTGDLARLDADGNCFIVDRKKDMIITGGENVYSREVEEVLYLHPAVAEAAVIGEPDPEWGENVVAVVQARDGAAVTGAELVEHCRRHLAGYKKPKRVVFVEELPRTAAGKVLKRDLRELMADPGGGTA